jgi:hypothetical protein
MNTLVETNKDKNTLIKLINIHRLENKNKWYQVSIAHKGLNYELKCYDTWVQLAHVYKDNKFLYNNPSEMDISISSFKEYLNGLIID